MSEELKDLLLDPDLLQVSESPRLEDMHPCSSPRWYPRIFTSPDNASTYPEVVNPRGSLFHPQSHDAPSFDAPVILTEQSYDKLGVPEAGERYEVRKRMGAGGNGGDRGSIDGTLSRRMSGRLMVALHAGYVNAVAYNFAGYLALW